MNEQNDPKRPPRRSRQARWSERNPLARWAHIATASAINRGLLTPEPCATCGEAKAEAHHPDHRQPLRVTWLCRPCHKRLHAAERRASQ